MERNFDEAHKRYAWACELLERAGGPTRVQYAATLSNMGALETAKRHYRKAEVLYRRALAIDESQLGANHPAVATDDSNIAAQLFYQKRTDEALELYEKARAVVEASFGPASLETARLWHNLAVVCDAGKQSERAVSAYRKAVETLDAFSAGNNPSLPSWLREYAGALRKEQRWAEAEAVETRALGIEVRKALAVQRQAASAAGGQSEQGKTPVGSALSS
jgi:tetratricopeptide (TPR) repeat protein